MKIVDLKKSTYEIYVKDIFLIILDKSKIIFDDTPENIFCTKKKQTEDLILKSNLDLPFAIKFINEIKKHDINLENTLDINILAELVSKY